MCVSVDAEAIQQSACACVEECLLFRVACQNGSGQRWDRNSLYPIIINLRLCYAYAM